MFSFELLDIILFAGISQGVFLGTTLLTVTNRNTAANKILSIVLFIATLMLIGRMIYFRFPNTLLRQIANFADTVIFLFGPLVYLYFRRLTFKEPQEYKLPLRHYILALIPILFFSWNLLYTPKEFRDVLRDYNISLGLVYAIIGGLGIVSNFYYWFKSFLLVRLYQKEEKNNISYSQYVTYFLYAFLTAVFLMLILWLTSFVNFNFFGKIVPFISYDMVWVSIPVFVYVVGYYSLKQPEIFRVPLKKIPKTKKVIVKNRLEGDALLRLKENLRSLMDQEKVYLDNELTLRGLSEKLQTSPNNVSWLLNNVYHSTFHDYINQFRVQEFIQKVEKGEHHAHTLLGLSLDSGFNSKSTFNKAFKTHMNDTPTSYIKKMSLN
ncbi:helix-turn-helix domain-containing protein [Aquimarina pacifica]|uniref:helix-turn-helix domain-containing protein n=1 Tax=Aquimarina pacifica TaxID=1296415 RepID=UPI000472D0CE|nr:helix-turn-helix domain-containing protein [Aquimarina pacifica]